ncbi:MAG: TonB family protein [Bdellovibrionia bacterium]
MKRLWLFLIISCTVHLFGGKTLQWLAMQFEPPKPPEQIEISFVENPESLIKNPNRERTQIVKEAFVPEPLRIKDEQHPARFKSKETVRVAQETQAAKSGATHNSLQQSLSSQPSAQDLLRSHKNSRQAIEKSPDGISAEERLAEFSRLQGLPRLSGPSTVGEALPTDIKVGTLTALNTDRYLFYSFYSRIEELVRYRWESRVYRAMDLFPPQVAARYPNRQHWKTNVLFTLDRRGLLQSATILSESGNKAFDMAAVEAFKEAGIFPNPPAELVEEDGLIRVYFGFQVNFSPRFVSGQN